ncbi:MAG TPA: hypothetical protein VHI13_16845 [Candidatus Kapabacteria bacterium]|nr:hypothetical protein [Candidatus Kapabacteria bacterium]
MTDLLLTIDGAINPDGTGDTVSVTLQTGGPELIPLLEGDVKKFAGGGKNDAGEWRWRHVAKLLPFSLDDATADHPPDLLDDLLVVLKRPFRRITAVSGLPLWPQRRYDAMLVSGAIDVMVAGWDFRYPYDGTIEVTLTLENRARGI